MRLLEFFFFLQYFFVIGALLVPESHISPGDQPAEWTGENAKKPGRPGAQADEDEPGIEGGKNSGEDELGLGHGNVFQSLVALMLKRQGRPLQQRVG